ncbi:MAG: hypothetical protein V1659_00290 [Candidatus Woesearchaeota archaeon]
MESHKHIKIGLGIFCGILGAVLFGIMISKSVSTFADWVLLIISIALLSFSFVQVLVEKW